MISLPTNLDFKNVLKISLVPEKFYKKEKKMTKLSEFLDLTTADFYIIDIEDLELTTADLLLMIFIAWILSLIII